MNESSYRCVVLLLKMFSVISWQSISLVKESRIPKRKPLISCKSQANYHIASTPCLKWDHIVISSDFSWQTSNFQTLMMMMETQMVAWNRLETGAIVE